MKKRYFLAGIGLIIFFSFLTFRLHEKPLGEFQNLVPMYPSAKIQSAVNCKDGSQIVFTTTDDSKKIFRFYKAELIKNGWAVRLERYGKDTFKDQIGENPSLESADFIAFYKENMGLMIDTSLVGGNTEAELYIGHTLK